MLEFLLIFLMCPLIVVVFSYIGFMMIKKWFVMPLLTLIIFTLLTFTVFNDSFIIWVVVFTLISVIVSLIMKSIYKNQPITIKK